MPGPHDYKYHCTRSPIHLVPMSHVDIRLGNIPKWINHPATKPTKIQCRWDISPSYSIPWKCWGPLSKNLYLVAQFRSLVLTACNGLRHLFGRVHETMKINTNTITWMVWFRTLIYQPAYVHMVWLNPRIGEMLPNGMYLFNNVLSQVLWFHLTPKVF